ncbi:hypothetical protein [Pelagicoccus sp. SDUM812002]|uniref:hypothetical protein n=1 Tax=Pelagicoccus sp. SDUM812002 TaxID=3041266 RepID=UPI00280DD28C|nr:hypothetical protein [Pelagicoccus sp. SDUM812002]MDQ8187482.1 hypothetical protein [Pelagicoccus sp. SDUM812002]
MNPELSSNPRRRAIVTAAILIPALACGTFATLSMMRGKLYSPFGVLVANDSTPSFYIGTSIYVTIGVTLLTSALIRIALGLSK